MVDPVKTQGHVKQMITRKTNYVIPGYSDDDQSYGIHPVYQSLLNHKELKSNNSLNVPSPDRVANMEALIITFVCEKRLPLSLTGDAVTLSRELAKLKRATTQYKLQLGVVIITEYLQSQYLILIKAKRKLFVNISLRLMYQQ